MAIGTKYRFITLILLGTSLLVAGGNATGDPEEPPCESKVVVKAVETVVIEGAKSKQAVKARIDTGAAYSSIDTGLIQRVGMPQTIGYVEVRSANGISRRPVIRLTFVLENRKITDRFSLTDRDSLEHPVLIGRSALQGFLVDPSR